MNFLNKFFSASLILTHSFAFAGGTPAPIQDAKLGIVTRAGIIAVKDFSGGGAAAPAPSVFDKAVLVLQQSDYKGKGKLRVPKTKTVAGQQVAYINLPGGQTDKGEKYTVFTAIRETREETADALKFDLKDLSKSNKQYHGYLFSSFHKNQLFVISHQYSIGGVAQKVKKAFANTNLPSDERESADAFAIPAQEFWDGVKRLAATWDTQSHSFSHADQYYTFQSRGDGKGGNRTTLYFDQHYLRALAAGYRRDTTDADRIIDETLK